MVRATSTRVPASRPAMRRGFPGNVRGGRSELPGRVRKELPAPGRERASRRRACALLLVFRMITMTRRRWIVAAVALIALAGLASVVALFFIDEPLRRYTEAKMNARLQGYTATIGALHFSPINFSLDLRDTVIVQHAHPDPPVTNIGRLYASVHSRAAPGRTRDRG